MPEAHDHDEKSVFFIKRNSKLVFPQGRYELDGKLWPESELTLKFGDLADAVPEPVRKRFETFFGPRACLCETPLAKDEGGQELDSDGVVIAPRPIVLDDDGVPRELVPGEPIVASSSSSKKKSSKKSAEE